MRETATSMMFNAAFSFGFAWLLFRSSGVATKQELILDALPQSFFVAFFGALIPGWLARRTIASGKMPPTPTRASRLPHNLFLRAIALALVATIAGVLLHVLVLTGLGINQLASAIVLIYKPVYGALLAMVITPVALFAVLAEPRESR